MGAPAAGRRRSTARAFSRCNVTLSACWRCSVAAAWVSPDCAASSRPRVRHVRAAEGPQPPAHPSATSGTNCKPSAPQVASVSLWLRLRASYAAAGCAPSAAVRACSPLRSPHVTARSKAAGPWRPHAGTQTSAGRRPFARVARPSSPTPASTGRGGSNPAFSSSGLRPAAAARAATRLRSLLWRFVRSPPQGQRRAWSPKQSAAASHSGQNTSLLVT